MFTKKKPIFLKEDSSAEQMLKRLKSEPATPEIEQKIKLIEMGILGEKQIRFELENSHMPMYVLHDLYLEHNGLTAQIDYMIVCPKNIYLVECKNLYGNIEIDEKGNFIRNLNYGKYFRKEGIYSPVTQNQRHLDLITAMRKDNANALIKHFISNACWKTVVVLANPKTVLNDKNAPKEIKDQVIRADQLIAYIKKCEAESREMSSSDKEMREIAETWISRSIPICKNCGVPMVKRIAKKGDNTGKELWGCPNFPKCRYKVF